MASAYTGYSSDVISRITRPPVRRRKSRTKARVASAVRLPTTKLTTNRVSGSRATWSQQSPRRASSGSQFFCFLPTNAHFSSNWASTVLGGKGDQLVVEFGGVIAGPSGVACDGVGVDAGETSGIAGADPLGHVSQDRSHLLRRQPRVEQGRALALGEAGLAGTTPEHAAGLAGSVARGDGEVAVPTLAQIGAGRVQTTERTQVVHDPPPLQPREAVLYNETHTPTTFNGHHRVLGFCVLGFWPRGTFGFG